MYETVVWYPSIYSNTMTYSINGLVRETKMRDAEVDFLSLPYTCITLSNTTINYMVASDCGFHLQSI